MKTGSNEGNSGRERGRRVASAGKGREGALGGGYRQQKGRNKKQFFFFFFFTYGRALKSSFIVQLKWHGGEARKRKENRKETYLY